MLASLRSNALQEDTDQSQQQCCLRYSFGLHTRSVKSLMPAGMYGTRRLMLPCKPWLTDSTMRLSSARRTCLLPATVVVQGTRLQAPLNSLPGLMGLLLKLAAPLLLGYTTERHQDFFGSSLQGGMEHQFVDWDLFHDISPISIHNEDDLSSFHIEPQSNTSSSHEWIGAQHYSPPQFHSDQDLSLEETIADTVIDTDTSRSSITQTWTQQSLQQKSQHKRKRSDSHQRSLQSDNLDEQDTQQIPYCSTQQNQGLSPQCSSHGSAC